REVSDTSSYLAARGRLELGGLERGFDRQLDPEARPGGQRLEAHRAAVRLDDAPRDGQPEARTGDTCRRGAAAVERLEDLLAVLGCDACPLVVDPDARAALGRRGADGDHAARRRILD